MTAALLDAYEGERRARLPGAPLSSRPTGPWSACGLPTAGSAIAHRCRARRPPACATRRSLCSTAAPSWPTLSPAWPPSAGAPAGTAKRPPAALAAYRATGHRGRPDGRPLGPCRHALRRASRPTSWSWGRRGDAQAGALLRAGLRAWPTRCARCSSSTPTPTPRRSRARATPSATRPAAAFVCLAESAWPELGPGPPAQSRGALGPRTEGPPARFVSVGPRLTARRAFPPVCGRE